MFTDTQDVDLDAILGELCALESQYDKELSQTSLNKSGNLFFWFLLLSMRALKQQGLQVLS